MTKQATAIRVSEFQRSILETIARFPAADAKAARRAHIILLAGEDRDDRDIARQLGIDRTQAARWRRRFAKGGVAAILAELPRSGRRRRIDAAEILRLTLQTKPEGAARWSTRKLAAKLGISDTTVLKVWQAHGIKPHLLDAQG